jgi:hypothetical protein
MIPSGESNDRSNSAAQVVGPHSTGQSQTGLGIAEETSITEWLGNQATPRVIVDQMLLVKEHLCRVWVRRLHGVKVVGRTSLLARKCRHFSADRGPCHRRHPKRQCLKLRPNNTFALFLRGLQIELRSVAAIVVCVILLLSCNQSYGVNPSAHITQCGHSVWRLGQDGLEGTPLAIAQTADGYIWSERRMVCLGSMESASRPGR